MTMQVKKLDCWKHLLPTQLRQLLHFHRILKKWEYLVNRPKGIVETSDKTDDISIVCLDPLNEEGTYQAVLNHMHLLKKIVEIKINNL